MKKTCSRCKKEKSVDDFHKCSRLPDGKRPECKTCTAEDAAKRKADNPEHIKALHRKSHQKHKISNNIKSSVRYILNLKVNRQKRKNWRLENPAYASEYHQRWYKDNRTDKLNKNRAWELRELTNPSSLLRIRKALRTRLWHALNKHKTPKIDKTMSLVGCDIDFLKSHLQVLFVEGMNWANYGKVWHIDHIYPCAKFDLTKIEEVKKCFHYTNLQPLFALDNIKKSDKILCI